MTLFELPLLLAQAAETDAPDQVQQVNPIVGAISGIIGLVIGLIVLAGMWKVFVKAGEPGWGCIIPIYNFYLLCKIGGKPGWWLILMLIPFVNFIILILVCIGIAENFGKGAGYGLGLAFLGVIFFPMLGFGDAQYRGAAGVLPGSATLA